MWRIRYKDTKEPFEFTTRIGYVGPGGQRAEIKGRMVRNMPHGCRRKVPLAVKAEYRRQLAAGEIKRIPTPAKTCWMCGACGKYYLGYGDEGRIVTALTSSRELERRGESFPDLEYINSQGKTMDEMRAFPVQKGYCLRHRKDKWLWMNPMTGRVWYRRAPDAERWWKQAEIQLAHNEGRDERDHFKKQSLVMCAGDDQGMIREMPFYE
jgi:hypothetical protein